jgi:hypothetical protein
MSTAGRISIAAAASALTVGIVFALLAVYPTPPIGRAFLAVGRPLAHFILEFAPDSFIRALAPQGGPDAVAWAIALGTFLTWFVPFFGLAFVLLGRLRSVANRGRSPNPLGK